MNKNKNKILINSFLSAAFIVVGWFLFGQANSAEAAQYQYTPTSGNLVTGVENIVTGISGVASGEGNNAGSWKGTISDDNFHWLPSSAAGGLDAQLNLGGVRLNGANKFIIQTEIDTDSNYNLKFQICDWVSSSSVDSAADAQCTGGGWRSLNSQSASNSDLNFTASTTSTSGGTSLQWHIYDGYFTTGNTGGSSLSTPLSNFIGTGGTVKVRYYSTTNGGALAIDYLRLMAIIDPSYHPAGFVNSGSGTPAGVYVNANYYGNTASVALAGGDNVHLAVPGTAGSISDSYIIYKNIKTYTGMNTVYVRGEYGCSAATANLRYRLAIRNFNTSTWENLGEPVDCAASNTDITFSIAKNNVTLSNYINNSSEIWIRKYGTMNSTTALRTDYQYITLGTTNTDENTLELNYGTATGGRVLSDPAPNNTDNINAVATDENYVYTAGFATVNQDSEWRIEKRDITTGALVTAFDGDGIVQVDPGTGADQIRAIAVDASYIYIAGYQNNGNDDWRIEKRDKTTGALVTAFDGDGIIATNSTPTANQDRIYGMWINSTHIFLAGEDGTTSTANRRWRIEKRDITTGALVNAFDTDGIVNDLNPSTGADTAYAITGDASYIYIAGVDVTTGTTGQWRIEKRDITTGALVNAFDTDGIVQRDPNTAQLEEALTVAVNSTHIYVGGYDRAASVTNDQWRVEKLDITTGALVTSFDSDGILNNPISAGQDRVTALLLDATDLYIVGEDRTEGTTASRWRIEKRSQSNGSLVTAFDGEGVTLAQYALVDRPLAASIQGTSIIVAGGAGGHHSGYANELWMLSKFSTSTGLPDTTFGAHTVEATRDLDMTQGANVFRIQAEDESSNSNDEFYPWDTESTPDTTAEEAAAFSVDFDVTVPDNAQVAGIYYGVNYGGGSGLAMQVAMENYTGSNSVTGGWVNMGAATNVSMLLTEPVMTGGFTTSGPAGYMATNPIGFIDTVNDKMGMRIRTSTPAANNVNPVADVDFMMVSFSWVESADHPSASYQFTPTGQTLVTGTSGARNSIVAAAGGGASVGSWKGTLADDNFHWSLTGTGAGFNAQLNLDGVVLNGANKIIIETETDLDAAAAMKVQICDWVSSSSVDSAADAQCTGGGWRTLNSQDANNNDINLTSASNGYPLQWHIYDGYWSTGATGGVTVSTPLTNFVKPDASKQVKIRYLSTLASATLDIDFLRVKPIIDSIYSSAGFVKVTGGNVTGTYANTNIIGNTTTGQISTVSADNTDSANNRLTMALTAGAVNEGYLVFKNIKTQPGMNSILVRIEYQCGQATGALVPKIRNFSTGNWENLSSSVPCSVSDLMRGWAKNNIVVTNYINGSDEIWVGVEHTTQNQTFYIDAAYVMLGSVNEDTGLCQATLGTGTASECSNTRTLDMTGTTVTFNNASELESVNMGTGDANAFYGYDFDSDTTAEHAAASNIDMPLALAGGTNVVGYNYALRFATSGVAATIASGLRDYSGMNTSTTGGWLAVGASNNTTTQVYTDPITALAINVYGQSSNSEDYLNEYDGLVNMRLRTSADNASAFTANWDFAMTSVQWIEFEQSAEISGTIYQADGITPDGTGYIVNISKNGEIADITTSDIDGTFTFVNYPQPASGDSLTIWLTGGLGTAVVKYGNECESYPGCAGLSVVTDQIRLYSFDGTSITNGTMNACSMSSGFGCGSTDIGFDTDGTNLTLSNGKSLYISTGTTFAPGGSGNVTAYSFINAGTYTASSGNLTVGDDFLNTGTFTPGSGTVTFNNASITTTVSGSNTFNNLTITTAGKRVSFTAGTTTTINGAFTVTGASGAPVILTSTTGSSAWTINHQGTEDIKRATIAWSACHASSTGITLTATSNSGGNNGTCWLFISKGVVDVPVDGGTPGGSGGTSGGGFGGGGGGTNNGGPGGSGGTGGSGSFAAVGGQRGSTAQVTSAAAISFNNDVTAGNLLIVSGVVAIGPGQDIIVTDTVGTNYTVNQAESDVGGAWLFIAHGIAASSGPNIVTVEYSPYDDDRYFSFAINEYSGVDTSDPFDDFEDLAESSSSTPSRSITTGSANALIIGVITGSSLTSFTVGSGWVEFGEEEDWNSWYTFNAMHRITTTAGAYSATWNISPAVATGMIAASFNVGGGGASQGGGGGGSP